MRVIMNPKYPIYIISKGRWDSRLTSKALEAMKVPYKIIIEDQEYDNYNKYISADKILVLPFSNLGKGSIPARNWVMEHSISIGAKRHWILDDNIRRFIRLNRNIKIKCTSGTIFKIAEDFVDRFENVPVAGFHYAMFCKAMDRLPPFYLNSRVYSCILIENTMTHRWRGRYNEDTDLSLRVLKDGDCTILFSAFLAEKIGTMTMQGGNTDELYADNGRLKMAESLAEQHPDVATVTWKFGRWHHQVDYRPFKKNKLVRKSDIELEDIINNYGMILIDENNNSEIVTDYEQYTPYDKFVRREKQKYFDCSEFFK